MADTYLGLVNSGITAKAAKALGLPRPAVLRRYSPGQPLLDGPVLLVSTASDRHGAGAITDVLTAWGSDVHTVDDDAPPELRWAAIVVDLSSATDPAALRPGALAVAANLRRLAASGRIVMLTRPLAPGLSPAVAALRQGSEGLLRSLAKELRAGATANAISIADGVAAADPSPLAALRFLLSSRSAFVDGQVLRIDAAGPHIAPDWDAPLRGRVAVVTGAARGIGAAIAATLHRDGAQLVLVDVPAAGDALASLANSLASRGQAATALQLDITTADAGMRILDHAITRHGGLDIVVHNAGITRDKLLANMDEARWDGVMEVNLLAQLRINAALAESGAFRDEPRIVSLASTSGIAGNRGQTNYAASKAGIIGMVSATAPLMAAYGGTANAVAPGFIETAMTAKIPLVMRQIARRLNSLQQGGLPQDVAEAVAFLASPAAGGIQGQTLRVCGQNLVGA